MPLEKNLLGSTSGVFLSDHERNAIVIDFTFQNAFGETQSMLQTGGHDPFHIFYLQYFRQLIHQGVDPAPPYWLEEGLVQMLAATEFSRRSIVFGKVGGNSGAAAQFSTVNGESWHNHGLNLNNTRYGAGPGGSMGGGFPMASYEPSSFSSGYFPQPPDLDSGASKPGSFNSALSHRPIMALGKFFAYEGPSSGVEYPENYSAHAYLFTHMCLYGRGQRYTNAFYKLVMRASEGPITEDVFAQCFGMSFRAMEREMRSYAGFTDYTAREFRAPKGQYLDEAPDFKLRDATDAESSRIAGEVLRLAGHQDAAVNRLIAPYVRGQYDADLLAALGLTELNGLRIDRARRFLEAAAKADTTRVKAYVELAGSGTTKSEARPQRRNVRSPGKNSLGCRRRFIKG